MKTYPIRRNSSEGLEIVFNKPELACRFIELIAGAQRPDGVTAHQALVGLKTEDPLMLDTALALADIASEYFLEICGVEPDA